MDCQDKSSWITQIQTSKSWDWHNYYYYPA